jgi:hypothetical protein
MRSGMPKQYWFDALNVILKSPNDVDSISELQIAHLKEKIKIVPIFDAASLYVKTRRQMDNKIAMNTFLSIVRPLSLPLGNCLKLIILLSLHSFHRSLLSFFG